MAALRDRNRVIEAEERRLQSERDANLERIRSLEAQLRSSERIEFDSTLRSSAQRAAKVCAPGPWEVSPPPRGPSHVAASAHALPARVSSGSASSAISHHTNGSSTRRARRSAAGKTWVIEQAGKGTSRQGE